MPSRLLYLSSSSLLISSISLLSSGLFWTGGTSHNTTFSGLNLVCTRSTISIKPSNNASASVCFSFSIEFVPSWFMTVLRFSSAYFFSVEVFSLVVEPRNAWIVESSGMFLTWMSLPTMVVPMTKFWSLLYRWKGWNSRLLTVPLLDFSAQLKLLCTVENFSARLIICTCRLIIHKT